MAVTVAQLHREIRATGVMVPTGHLPLTLTPGSWVKVFEALFEGVETADMRFLDVCCGVGHAVQSARLCYGVGRSKGVDFDPPTIEAAKLIGDRLPHPQHAISFGVGDLTSPTFTLRGFTHCCCFIDSTYLTTRFVELAQRARCAVIAFILTREMAHEIRQNAHGFFSWQTHKVTLEGGRCSRTVVIAVL